jgi:hypothetical protein
MSDKLYTMKTAAMKATKADIRNLDAKQIKLNGKPIIGEISDLREDTATDNDIWPNGIQIDENGNATFYPLGHNKVIIPNEIGFGSNSVFKGNKIFDKNTGEILQWIDSDSLIVPPDGTEMTVSFSCEGVDTSLNGISDFTNFIFNLYDCKEFKVDMPNNYGILSIINHSSSVTSITLNAPKLFSLIIDGTENISEFSGDLRGLPKANDIYFGPALISFSVNLSSLQEGMSMFEGCNNLTDFKADLSMLLDAGNMFTDCSSLETFTTDLPSLEFGRYMFSGCYNLNSFSSNLFNLREGENMFGYCEKLESFTSDLSNLMFGTEMFTGCKLNAHSVSNIVHLIPQRDDKPTGKWDAGNILIGIGCDDTEEDRLLFAQECHCDTWQELLDEFSAKNWTVTLQYNGRPTTTYNMRRGETLPVFVKLEEVIMPTEEEKLRKPRYSHTSLDGSKFYRLTYFHSTNGSTDGYTQFNSIEEAEQTFEITPKQQIEK